MLKSVNLPPCLEQSADPSTHLPRATFLRKLVGIPSRKILSSTKSTIVSLPSWNSWTMLDNSFRHKRAFAYQNDSDVGVQGIVWHADMVPSVSGPFLEDLTSFHLDNPARHVLINVLSKANECYRVPNPQVGHLPNRFSPFVIRHDLVQRRLGIHQDFKIEADANRQAKHFSDVDILLAIFKDHARQNRFWTLERCNALVNGNQFPVAHLAKDGKYC